MRSVVGMILLAFMISCGGGGNSGSSSGGAGNTGGSSPINQGITVSNISIFPSTVPLGQGGGSTSVSIIINFNDTTAQVSGLKITDGNTSQTVSLSISPETVGATQTSFMINTSQLGTRNLKFECVCSDGLLSNPVTANFSVGPGIQSFSPINIAAGGPSLVLTVMGVGFTTHSTIQWNGNNKPTTYVSPTLIQANLSTQDILNSGLARAIVVNPDSEGGATLPISIPVNNVTAKVAGPIANDIAWDPFRQVIYASYPSNSGALGNRVASIDPTTGDIINSLNVGSEPNRLALSGDGNYLYVGLDGSSSIQRLQLPNLTPDISIQLGSDPNYGPYYALDLQVAPGRPNTIAVSLGCRNLSVPAVGGIVVFDDTIARLNRGTGPTGLTNPYGSIQWGIDDTHLYACNDETTGGDYYVFTVSSGGVYLVSDLPYIINPFYTKIHFDTTNSMVYADSGQVLVPDTGVLMGTFSADGSMTTDPVNGLAYFAGINWIKSTNTLYMNCFNLKTFSLLSTASLVWGNGNPVLLQPSRTIKTPGGTLIVGGRSLPVLLLSGPFVQGN